ncbi:protein toll [Caerostris extrusa]|uniref:Protein toll n=1 Tax=Caerostris extrusa TaxID=172846 RepID=A0AAV4TYD5_CAEEX|nr:protein toll [Caerostris extrusa]
MGRCLCNSLSPTDPQPLGTQLLTPHVQETSATSTADIMSPTTLARANCGNLDYIFLNNNISDLSGVLHDSNWGLRTLDLSYNPERIAPNMFGGKVRIIRYLYLDHCLIREFDEQIWDELPSLEVLDLSFNLIDKVTNRYITEVRKRSMVSSLRFDHNLFTSLGPALRYNPMIYFSMADNLIAHLGPEDLQGEQTVRHLDLQGNVIAQVERLTFAKVSDLLLFFDLSRNRIKSPAGFPPESHQSQSPQPQPQQDRGEPLLCTQ